MKKPMNKLLLATLILVFSSCNYEVHPKGKVIIEKQYTLETFNNLPPCICWYKYKDVNSYTFQDSCNKYNIGDTIN